MLPRLLACLGGLALIAACGNDDPAASERPEGPLEAAARRTAEVQSYRQQFRMNSDLGGVHLIISGQSTLSVPPRNGTMKGEVFEDYDELKFEAIVADGVTYVRGEGGGLPSRKWVRTRQPTPARLTPAELVAILRGADGVERVGSDTVRGEPTTQYRAPLDLDTLANVSSVAGLREMAEDDQLDIVMNAWLKSDGLPARITVQVIAPRELGGGRLHMTSNILEYDVPVDTDPPPASQIVNEEGS